MPQYFGNFFLLGEIIDPELETLQHSPAEILQQYLVDKLVGVQPSDENAVWPIFVGRLPDQDNVPANCIMVSNTDPNYDGRLMRNGQVIEHPGIQVRCRAVDYPTGYNKIKAVQVKLDSVRKSEVGIDSATYTVSSVKRFGGILQMGTDEQGREEFSLNATTTLIQTSS